MPSESVPVRWLEPPQHQYGTTFGLPWHKGRYKSGDTTFTCTTDNGQEVPLQTWVTAYWPDDSIKWTAHAIPAGDAPKDGYIVHAGPNHEVPPSNEPQSGGGLRIQDSADAITVSTGAVTATFPKAGHTLISRLINSAGRTVCTNGHLVLLTQSAIADDDDGDVLASPITHRKLTSTIASTTTLSHSTGPIRTTIKITGHHQTPNNPQEPLHSLLPFTLLITLHAHSPLLRLHLTHTISLEGEGNTTTIRGLALRLAAIPLAPAAPFNHHVRLTTTGPAPLLAEAAQGLTGLWKDPGAAVREAQVEQRKWYGFWDHGDIMHTYDADRHTWRYDVGGYAWDNSELSPDLWLWLYFLRTGRADVYRMAEALTRHTGEVDVYHLGKYKGLGTRHGVQHWSDSCKQARISNALYRRYFYYLSGGDERVGDLMEETLETEKTFLTLDPYRKVRKDRDTYRPDPTALTISLGTDWSALAAAWFIEWQRRGPKWEEAKNKLLTTIKGIGSLRNGFVTGQVTYNLLKGEISPPAEDPENNGVVKISHLSAMFGLFEICSDILDSLEVDTPPGFKKAWLDYCYYFNAPAEEQIARFG
ncbi:putative secreted protein [Diplodia seriata]|uniref:Putative secreted protein n=1 Tax=Diplodia seriata TaxID=420778 RepID=A0A0G2DV63_9PEZI|nr:putative secreted protein [Diplodia seriata]